VLVVYSPQYAIDIGSHVFPTTKYRRVYERVLAASSGSGEGASRSSPLRILEPHPASWDDLARVHSREYLARTQSGELPIAELAQLEIPWSPDVVEGFRLMTGGTLTAARHASAGDAPVVFHVGGGFHHAFPNHGEGFCLFNDVAVAIRVMLHEGAISSAAVIDLDVHHGNGTAFTFADDSRVFTFSMHQQNNYPAVKPRGSLDIGLLDGIDDEPYLRKLDGALTRVFAHRHDIVFYLAGADPYEDDQLGGLALTKGGLRARDRAVLRTCAEHRTPVVVVLAGGYARNLEDTVDIHFATFDEACSIEQQR
jgi:acetoin utilization deacetylase AcuC-like enzyme